MKSTRLMKIAGKILSKNKYSINRLANINTELGIISYQSKNYDFFQEESALKKESAGYKIYCKVVETAKNDNKRLIELNKQTRYILNGKLLSAETKGKILEKLGYEVI